MRTFLTILTQPKKTFEYLDNHEGIDPEVNIDVLFYLSSLASVIPTIPAFVSPFETKGEPVAVQIIIALFGVIIGTLFVRLLFKYVHSYILWKLGKIFEGKASKSQVQMVFAYSLIPGLISLLFSLVLIIVAIFMKDINIIGYQNPFTLLIIWILGFRTLIFGLARFNRFSYEYAIMNVILVATMLQGLGLGIKYLMQ